MVHYMYITLIRMKLKKINQNLIEYLCIEAAVFIEILRVLEEHFEKTVKQKPPEKSFVTTNNITERKNLKKN